MKKILSSAMILIMILCCATPCFAAKETLNNEKLSTSMDVKVKYIRLYMEEEGYTSIKGEDGKFSETTNSGLKVELEAKQEELALIIHEITAEDEGAAKWFQGHFAGAKNIAPLEFFMADEGGKRHELPAGTKITLTGLKADQYVVRISSDGYKDRIPEAVVDGSITFETTEAGHYYVVVTPGSGILDGGQGGTQKPEGEGQGGTQEPEEQKPALPQKPGNTTGQPDTGDHSHLWLWIGMMAVSAAGIIVVAKMRKA